MTNSTSTGIRKPTGARLLGAVATGLVALAVALGVVVVASGLDILPPLRKDPGPRLLDALSRTIETQGIDAAVAQYRELRERGFPELYESEGDTNRLGYRLLGSGETAGAIQVFRLNVETHPGSANVHDSLGEAYVAAGEKALAIESYEKAVAIRPGMKSAESALRRLTGVRRTSYRPMVLFHIGTGSLAMLAGAGAMSLRKGSRRHGRAGTVFFVSMLALSASGAFMAFTDPDGDVINVLMGILTFYLVATAWLTARRREPRIGRFDWIALFVPLAVATGLARYGFEAARSATGTKDGIAAGLYLTFGAVALLAGALDLRMIARGGVAGAQRIARHLWRMCFALFVAVGSLFLGQPQVFPDELRRTGLLALPPVLVLALLAFWLIRVRFTRAFAEIATPESRAGADRAAA